MNNMVVMKFGGASIANGERMLHVAKVIQKFGRKKKILVIVSAMQGVTDNLIALFQRYKTGKIAEGAHAIQMLRQMHVNTLGELKLNKEEYRHVEKSVSDLFEELNSYLTGHDAYTLSDCDYILSFGERVSSYLVAAALKRYGIQADVVDASSIIVATEAYSNARVFLGPTRIKSRKVLLPLLANKIVPVVTGFFASTKRGAIVTLGRGGSDYSATVLANALSATEVILWKEVDGVFGEDPKKNSQAKLYLRLSYKRAMDLARKGAKVLHPEAIKPAAAKGIVIWVRNIFRPDFAGTKIWEEVI